MHSYVLYLTTTYSYILMASIYPFPPVMQQWKTFHRPSRNRYVCYSFSELGVTNVSRVGTVILTGLLKGLDICLKFWRRINISKQKSLTVVSSLFKSINFRKLLVIIAVLIPMIHNFEASDPVNTIKVTFCHIKIAFQLEWIITTTKFTKIDIKRILIKP